jgi:DNA-binding CsgD family transcriptional regulator
MTAGCLKVCSAVLLLQTARQSSCAVAARQAVAGICYFCTRRIPGRWRSSIDGQDGFIPQLSAREKCIPQCLREGDANKVIAREVDIPEATVKVHVKSILRKIGVHNRTQAAIWAMNHDPLGTSQQIVHEMSRAQPDDGAQKAHLNLKQLTTQNAPQGVARLVDLTDSDCPYHAFCAGEACNRAMARVSSSR